MGDCELIALISTIACAIIKCSTIDEISILSVSLTQLGDTLATFLAQREIAENREKEKEEKKKCENEDKNDVEE